MGNEYYGFVSKKPACGGAFNGIVDFRFPIGDLRSCETAGLSIFDPWAALRTSWPFPISRELGCAWGKSPLYDTMWSRAYRVFPRNLAYNETS